MTASERPFAHVAHARRLAITMLTLPLLAAAWPPAVPVAADPDPVVHATCPADESATNADDAAAAFDRLKTLVGTWTGTNDKGDAVRSTYELVAAGSALLERYELPHDGRPVTMITMYTLDGDALALTHYCIAGNQPRMRAVALGRKEIRFEMTGAGNLTSLDAGHMHAAVLRLDGPDSLRTAWTWREDGADRFTATADLTRVETPPVAER